MSMTWEEAEKIYEEEILVPFLKKCEKDNIQITKVAETDWIIDEIAKSDKELIFLAEDTEGTKYFLLVTANGFQIKKQIQKYVNFLKISAK